MCAVRWRRLKITDLEWVLMGEVMNINYVLKPVAEVETVDSFTYPLFREYLFTALMENCDWMNLYFPLRENMRVFLSHKNAGSSSSAGTGMGIKEEN